MAISYKNATEKREKMPVRAVLNWVCEPSPVVARFVNRCNALLCVCRQFVEV